MKPTSACLIGIIKAPKPELVRYSIPDIKSILVKDLPGRGFGSGNYFIPKTKFNHWPVYKKVQNTKIQTEIKRIQGDLQQLKRDLLKFDPELVITMNQTAGIMNVKGDVVKQLMALFEEQLAKAKN